MTNIPVSAGMKTYFQGSGKSRGMQACSDADGSFSDILKNQKDEPASFDVKNSDDIKSNAGIRKEPVNADKPRRAEQDEATITKPVKKSSAKETSESDEVTAKVAIKADNAVEYMLESTEKELAISEEELLSVLQSLFMTPEDLLSSDGLQKVILAVSGEEDFAGFITNEQLFTSFKNLSQDLNRVVSEVAQATGLSEERVQEIFTNLAQTEEVNEEIGPVETEAIKTDNRREDFFGSTQPNDSEVFAEKIVSTGKVEEKKENGKNANANSFHESQTNAFSPDLKAQQTQGPQAAENVSAYFDTDTIDIMRQITDYLKGQVKDGISQMEMQLHPANLGTLHIHLISKEGVLTAQFTAQNETVKAALESQMIQLQETFKEQGITVESIEVMVSSRKFEQSYEDAENSAGNGNGQSGKHKTRRMTGITLDNEDLTEEEILTKEVLMANGSTVEYSA